MISSSILGTQVVHSIRATLAQTDFLGHGYVFETSILSDMDNLFQEASLPNNVRNYARNKLQIPPTGSCRHDAQPIS